MRGKIVFRETGPWCQNDLGLLLHMKVVKRVNPKNSLLNLLWYSFYDVYVRSVLYANLHTAVCQLCLSKTERKKLIPYRVKTKCNHQNY